MESNKINSVIHPIGGGGGGGDNSTNKGRIDFIDLAKGFCIIMVVYYHVYTKVYPPSPIDGAISIFRMPLYFFLSGLFFKTYEGFCGFLKRKINKLLIPFLFFSSIVLLLSYLLFIP